MAHRDAAIRQAAVPLCALWDGVLVALDPMSGYFVGDVWISDDQTSYTGGNAPLPPWGRAYFLAVVLAMLCIVWYAVQPL